MNIQERKSALIELGKLLGNESFESARHKAWQENQWFTPAQTETAFRAWAEALSPDAVEAWAARYQLSASITTDRIGIVMAGNIPMVGLHDLLCCVLAGKPALVKLSSDDKVLIPALVQLWAASIPALTDMITFVEQLQGFHSVIATGSNNTARHFEYYFRKVPSLIRGHRSSAAIITGLETAADFQELGKDLFTYFGLGCRNVSKLYVPESFEVAPFYEGIASYNELLHHNKYANNHTYHKALHLMNLNHIYDNDFLILLEAAQVSGPVAVCHYEKYKSSDDLIEKLIRDRDQLQCVVSASGDSPEAIRAGMAERVFAFGKAQAPALWDYADGLDTLQWLLELPVTHA